MATFALRKLVDDDQWEAEDFTGRLGIAAHAAFLHAGFVPYGDEPRSGHLLKQVDETGPFTRSLLSRRYTAPQLARAGATATDVAVLELRVRGEQGDVALQAYLLTGDSERRLHQCDAFLLEAVLAPHLCCHLADAARDLETGFAGAWFWKPLAYWVLPTLFFELCRRNNLPVAGFMSLPDDAKLGILKRITDSNDLARVECVSKQLRRLVTERDGELWKAIYESLSLGLLPELQSSDEVGRWKDRYLNTRRLLLQHQDPWERRYLSASHRLSRQLRRYRRAHLRRSRSRVAAFPPPGQ